ncbi:MAG: hypothetical protein NTY60_00735 [Proteobacteria bacterium]|nr:hypothetical protein [Pseudomonadota bacterium]
MSIVTMNMSSFEIEHNDSATCDNKAMSAGRNPAPTLQQQTANRKPDAMPRNMIAMNTDAFMKRMYAIEVNAEVFLKSMYAYQH